jgi:hypothetical protein
MIFQTLVVNTYSVSHAWLNIHFGRGLRGLEKSFAQHQHQTFQHRGQFRETMV